MTDADVLKLINDATADLTLLMTIAKSPGYAHSKDLLAKVKGDAFIQETVCNLFKIDPLKLPELLNTAGQALVLVDGLVTKAPEYIAFLNKLKDHDVLLKVIARFLG